MKKLQLIASMVLGLSLASHAQFLGAGWDGSAEEVVGRVGLGGFSTVEVGLGLRYDGSQEDDNVAEEDERTTFSLSARYLHALHAWEKFTGYLHGGLYFRDDNNNGDSPTNPFSTNGSRAAALAVFLGYQPEVILINHLAVSTKFGVSLPVTPDFKLGLVGDDVSIVQGFDFRILW
jgi:hypothetical protein